MRYDTICSFTILVFWKFSFHMVTKASFCIFQQTWFKAYSIGKVVHHKHYMGNTARIYTCLTFPLVLLSDQLW